MKSIQTFLEEFNCIHFEEKPQILLEAWFKFFAIKRAQPEDSNKLFQKLLEDLKELAEYKESLKNSSKEIAVSNSNQEKEDPPQDSDIRQLIREECCVKVKVSKEQKQKIEDTIIELVKICRQKELYCIHDNVEDLIESALDSKLLSINLNSQRLNKKEQEVKNDVEQPVELGTQEPEHSLSMGYKHLSITPETESNKVTESNPENLLPIPSECEVTSEDEFEYDMSAKHDCSPLFTIFSNPLFNNDDFDSSDDESLPDEDVPTDEFKEEIRLIENLLYDNSSPRPPEELNAEIADTIVESIPSLPILVKDGDSQKEEINIVTETDDVLPLSVENDDDSSNDPLLEEADLFLASDNLIPPGIENVADDSEGDIRFLEELLIDDSILSHESSDSNFEDNPSISRPPPEPPDAETDEGKKILVMMNDKDMFDEDYHFFMSDKVFSFLFAESEDMIFDPGISV
nr:hypothetical protein [Tanacetum cinerariifolium]